MTSPFRTSLGSSGRLLPTPPEGWVIGSYPTYERAQAAVDHLADNHYPVHDVTIVGVDLMQVERVTGRLTWPKVLGGGALSGAWFGLFIGLLLAIFLGPRWEIFVTALLAGAVFGIVTSAVSYAAQRGRRDFASVSELVAGRYDVLGKPESAEQLRDELARFGMRAR